MKGNYLSVLKNAGPKSICYYVGNDISHVSHLKECTLICHHGFEPVLDGVELIHVNNPQLEFYKLSANFKEDYLDNGNLVFSPRTKAYIHKDAKIGKGVKIGAGSIIANVSIEDNVEIHANVVIYAKTIIKKDTIIESNTTIGGTGMMWVWDKKKRIYLEQLGNVVIEAGCRIGTQCEIVRGSVNESTVIGEGTCIAHGTFLGHGNTIGKYNHFANGVKLGGGCSSSDYNFFGSGAVLSAGIKILSQDVILGAGAIVVKNISEEGVYVGNPAKRIKTSTGKLSGIPMWDR